MAYVRDLGEGNSLYNMFRTLPIGVVWVCGENLEINAMIETITGYSQNELKTKRDWFACLTGDKYEHEYARYEKERSAGFNKVIELTFFRKDGEQRIVDITASLNGKQELWLVRDITAVLETSAKLEESHKALKNAEKMTGVASWGLDLKTNALTWSDNMFDLLGQDRNKMFPTLLDLKHILTDESYAQVMEKLDLCTKMGIPYNIDIERRANADSPIYLVAIGQAIRNESGDIYKVVGTVQDVTEQRKAAIMLKDAKERAEDAERAKTEFLAIMSHEIRTPMNTVLGMTHLALNTELTAQQTNYLSKIDSAARTLIKIINEVLDFSKIGAGKLSLEYEKFSIDSLLETVSTVTTLNADQKGLEVIYSIAPDVPHSIRGDQLRLGQVLTNLINNAVKFTEEGEVELSITLEDKPEDGCPYCLQFEVRDTGIGMDEEKIHKLFQAFSQGDEAVTRKYGGTGLGLLISKQLIELMGGRVWVDSEVGKGSTFGFTVPVQQESQASTDESALLPLYKGKRALIIDNNEILAEKIKVDLESFGMEAEHCKSGADGIRRLIRCAYGDQSYDIVFIDSKMPGMSGRETAELIRKSPNIPQVAMVLMGTGYGRDSMLSPKINAAFDAILMKPILRSGLHHVVGYVFSHPVLSKNEEVMDESSFSRISSYNPREKNGSRFGMDVSNHSLLNIEPNSIAIETKKYNFSKYNGLLVDDNAVNREVIVELLKLSGLSVDTAVNGADALEKISSKRYDIVLMDIQMPVMDGLEATRRIRNELGLGNLPVIALTAQVQDSDRDAALLAGVNAHLTKPVDEYVLYKTISTFIESADVFNDSLDNEPFHSGIDIEELINEFSSIASTIDLREALERLSGRLDLYWRLVQVFVRDFSDSPDKLAGGICDGKMGEIVSLTHTIKSSAAYVGANSLSKLASKIEREARERDVDAIADTCEQFKMEHAQVVLDLDKLAKLEKKLRESRS